MRYHKEVGYVEKTMFHFAIFMKVRNLIKNLEKDGWEQTRMKGSHRQFRHFLKKGTVTVAGNPGADVPPGTLASILKQAGLK